MRPFQAALDTPLDSPFSATLSVHGLRFTVCTPSKFYFKCYVILLRSPLPVFEGFLEYPSLQLNRVHHFEICDRHGRPQNARLMIKSGDCTSSTYVAIWAHGLALNIMTVPHCDSISESDLRITPTRAKGRLQKGKEEIQSRKCAIGNFWTKNSAALLG